MPSDIVLKTLIRIDPKTVGPTPPTPPLITLRPGRRLVAVARLGRAAVEIVWPTRAGGKLEITSRGKGVWVNRQVTGKTVGPVPPTPPLMSVVNVLQAAGFTIEVSGSDGALLVEVRPARVLVDGAPLQARRPPPRKRPAPPLPMSVGPRDEAGTTAKTGVGPEPEAPPG